MAAAVDRIEPLIKNTRGETAGAVVNFSSERDPRYPPLRHVASPGPAANLPEIVEDVGE